MACRETADPFRSVLFFFPAHLPFYLVRSSGHGSCRAATGLTSTLQISLPWIHHCLLRLGVLSPLPSEWPFVKVLKGRFAQRSKLPRCYFTFFPLQHIFHSVGDLAAVMRTPRSWYRIALDKKYRRQTGWPNLCLGIWELNALLGLQKISKR